jgi:DNA-binding transcriptional MocR family regulator
MSRLDFLQKQYDSFLAQHLNLDMSRGKPAPSQLDLSSAMLNCPAVTDFIAESGVDCRNYGGLDGLSEMKRLFADLLDASAEEIIVGGNSSLTMMFDRIAAYCSHGVLGDSPWHNQKGVKFICPVPGYDRHFAICEYFGIQMITVPMLDSGPAMDLVEELVKDPLVKGMWCVPLYSNPTGCVYSADTVLRLAHLAPAAKDFRIFWDNAYRFHSFTGEPCDMPNIRRECENAGRADMVLEFTSFSKVSFAGSAVAAMACSEANRADYLRRVAIASPGGPDKINQLRHVRFFQNARGVYAHMKKLGALIQPKFEAAITVLQNRLADTGAGTIVPGATGATGATGVAEWTTPKGGYFISVYTKPGCAARTIALCKEAGVRLTNAGAAFPYGRDPQDSHIRLAPTYPTVAELTQAMEIFCVSLELASL